MIEYVKIGTQKPGFSSPLGCRGHECEIGVATCPRCKKKQLVITDCKAKDYRCMCND